MGGTSVWFPSPACRSSHMRSWPALLAELPISFRYSIRGLPQGVRASVNQLGVVRRNWFQKRKGARAIFSESIGTGGGAGFDNQHALRMAEDADDAIAEAEGGAVRFCYATLKIVLTADTAAEAEGSGAAGLQDLSERGLRSAYRDS